MSFSWSQGVLMILLIMWAHTLHASGDEILGPCSRYDCFRKYLCAPGTTYMAREPCDGRECVQEAAPAADRGAPKCLCNDGTEVPPSGICPDACAGQDCKDDNLCYDNGKECMCNDGSKDLANCPDRCENLQCAKDGLCIDTPIRGPGYFGGPTSSGCSCTFRPRHPPPHGCPPLDDGPPGDDGPTGNDDIPQTGDSPPVAPPPVAPLDADTPSRDPVGGPELYPLLQPTKFGVCPGPCTDLPCLLQNLCKHIEGQCVCNNWKAPLLGQCEDACEGRPCHEKHLCDDIKGVCSCQDELRFNDENDCVDDCAGRACAAPEEQTCEPVNRVCSCRDGLVFDKEKNLCVLPCKEKDCFEEGKCSNQYGKCICDEGLRFDSDHNRCIDDCDGRKCAMNSVCTETYQKCRCQTGLIFDALEDDCIDPCEGKLCLADRMCAAIDYRCECLGNRMFDEDRESCIDVNPCRGLTCYLNRLCGPDSEGRCLCNAGYRFEGSDICTDIDECKEGETCGRNEFCQDTVGSYLCLCSKGYVKNNEGICVDEDECSSGTAVCSENSECANEVGTYRCTERRPQQFTLIFIILGVSLGIVLLVSTCCCLFCCLRLNRYNNRSLQPVPVPVPVYGTPIVRPRFNRPIVRRGPGYLRPLSRGHVL